MAVIEGAARVTRRLRGQASSRTSEEVLVLEFG
jgi:hypothetical protein